MEKTERDAIITKVDAIAARDDALGTYELGYLSQEEADLFGEALRALTREERDARTRKAIRRMEIREV